MRSWTAARPSAALGLGVALALVGLAFGAGDHALPRPGLLPLPAGVVEVDARLGERDGGAGALDGPAVEELFERPRGREPPRVAGPPRNRGVGGVVALGRDRREGEASRGNRQEEVELGAEPREAGGGAELLAGRGPGGPSRCGARPSRCPQPGRDPRAGPWSEEGRVLSADDGSGEDEREQEGDEPHRIRRGRARA